MTKVSSIEHRGAYAQHDLQQVLDDKKGTYSMAGHEAQERAIIRYATLDEARKTPDFAHEGTEGSNHTQVDKVGYGPLGETPGKDDSMFGWAWKYDRQEAASGTIQNKWGMAIDLNSCTGLQRVHRELLCGEQHSGGGARTGEGWAQHAVDPHRHLL